MYKISEKHAKEIIGIGNKTGFHWIPMDYGFGLCLHELPVDSNYDAYRNYIASNGLVPTQIDLHLEQSGNYSFTEIDRVEDAINMYDKRVQEAKNGVVEHTINKLQDNVNLTQEEINACIPVYPLYVVNKGYKIGDVFSYNLKLYRVNQLHTSQSDWIPSTTKVLYTEIVPVGVIPVWKQPEGGHDAYKKGDRVHFPIATDPVYESLIEANVWSPTAYPAGWKKL